METENSNSLIDDLLLPANGRVVIIDDKIEEAIPLINVLSQHRIPSTYFDGTEENLPETPLENVRIVFLDIQLEGMEGVQNDKTKLSALANVITKIIGHNTFPYIIVAWTKHSEIVNDITGYFGKTPKPLITLTVDKTDCQTGGKYDLKKINDRLCDKVKEFGAFGFFLEWENIVHTSAGRTVNEISSIVPPDNNWNNNINEVLKILAEAYAGQQAGNNLDLNAMLAINNLLLDIIENRIQNRQSSSLVINEQTQSLTDMNQIKGELNRRLLIAYEQNSVVVPGNVYQNNSEDFAKIKCNIEELCNNRNTAEVNNSKHIFLEVSPYCDYAQKKWKCHRILPGIMWPEQHAGEIKKADYIYKSPLFFIDNALYYFVFDLRYLTSVEPDKLKNKQSLFRFRKELLVDIQSKISGHINRPGITYAG